MSVSHVFPLCYTSVRQTHLLYNTYSGKSNFEFDLRLSKFETKIENILDNGSEAQVIIDREKTQRQLIYFDYVPLGDRRRKRQTTYFLPVECYQIVK